MSTQSRGPMYQHGVPSAAVIMPDAALQSTLTGTGITACMQGPASPRVVEEVSSWVIPKCTQSPGPGVIVFGPGA